MCLYTVQRSVRTCWKILRESETRAGGRNVAGRKYRLSESKLKLGKKTERDKGQVRDTKGRVEWPEGGNTIQVNIQTRYKHVGHVLLRRMGLSWLIG